MHAGAALGSAGLGLGHAMAQALGGRYGISHGALNAVVLAPARRFNEPVAGDDVPGAVEDLARMAGFERLRDLGVPEPELPVVAAAAAERVGAKANPRAASPDEIADLLRSGIDFRLATPGDKDIGALRDKALGGGESQPAASTGDECNFPRKFPCIHFICVFIINI